MKKLAVITAVFTLFFTLAVAQAAQQGLGNRYVGNAESGIYHNSGCKYFTCKKCTVKLASPKEAAAKGFKACKVCGGG